MGHQILTVIHQKDFLSFLFKYGAIKLAPMSVTRYLLSVQRHLVGVKSEEKTNGN